MLMWYFTDRRSRRVRESVLVADGDCRKSHFVRVLNSQADGDRTSQEVADAVLDLERGECSPGKQQQDPDGPAEGWGWLVDDITKSDDRRLAAEPLRSCDPRRLFVLCVLGLLADIILATVFRWFLACFCWCQLLVDFCQCYRLFVVFPFQPPVCNKHVQDLFQISRFVFRTIATRNIRPRTVSFHHFYRQRSENNEIVAPQSWHAEVDDPAAQFYRFGLFAGQIPLAKLHHR